MNLAEFKSWLAGFDEAIDEAPSPEQWKKIKAKLDETEPVKMAPTQFSPSGFRQPADWVSGEIKVRNE